MIRRRVGVGIVMGLALSFGLVVRGWAQEGTGGSADAAAKKDVFTGLTLRGIGPALMSGRVSDIAVDPVKRSTWYVVAASGGVWKTTNSGTTWTPIFDGYGSYSIGCVAVDPQNHLVVWVGTGENNSQRSVGYGDGVYKSIDGGASFSKVGLETSEHIAKVLIDPRNSSTVYVAAQGPLWKSGGDRGLYKTTDGGKTWKTVLMISVNTGVTDVVFDPRNPDVLYAAAYQRRRHVWTLIDGGPESGLYRSTDAGQTWRKINKGLPDGDKGRIGLAISPVNPDVLYATLEATRGQSGFFRSDNGGETWAKQSSYIATSPQYYQEIVADPHTFDRVYAMDTLVHVSEDGGKTFRPLGEKWKHVDNHALWIDPRDSDHLLIGCDGGLYETWDRGQTYRYTENLPITQFYKIAVDNDAPFYNVYGGTQDNATQGGPSRTSYVHGIRNSDWFVTVFGDGFDPVIDPTNPNIIYSQWQYGGLVRYDRRSGERIDIKPQEDKGGPPLRWNWDSALILSPHSPTRLYYGSQILFRSDDRGDTWKAISPDLTRNVDRNKLKVMERVWSVDAVAKNDSTSFYGTIVALAESPLAAGLIYAGTDDGLIQVTEDGGKTWRKVENFPFTNKPSEVYVSDIEASRHDSNTVYACFDNHKNGDFRPYVLRSTDRGKSWVNIGGDLPERGSTYTIAADHETRDLLFVGTEFGVFATRDGGLHWHALKGGVPTIAVRDLEIQRRESDLVVGTFGRGIYILDDYSPLRSLTPETLAKPSAILPVKKALLYVPAAPLSGGEKAFQGASFYTAPNPPFGATFTYYLKDALKTRKAARREQEQKLEKEGKDVFYPAWDALKIEDREEAPALILTIRSAAGQVVRRLTGPTSSGLHRVSWDLRWADYRPVTGTAPARPGDEDLGFFLGGRSGPLALPGRYTVSLDKREDQGTAELVPPTPFEVEPLNFATLAPSDRAAVLAFARQTGELQRAVLGTIEALNDGLNQVTNIKRLIEQTPSLTLKLRQDARSLELKLVDLRERFTGDPTRARRNEPAGPGLIDRIDTIISGHWATTSAATGSHRRNYEIAAAEFEGALASLRPLLEHDLPALHDTLEAAGAPWTPGRKLPKWKR
ncbi:MAG: glycosyl hydrolase [Isosphaerales bacterium]